MRTKIIVLSILCICLWSCINNNSIVKNLNVDVPLNEKCFFFIDDNLDTLRFEREIKITKNTITDTIIFGQGVLPPKFIGDIGYTKLGNRIDKSLDLDYENPPATRICINSYKGKKSQGVLVLELIPINQ